jgi:hypothetical protein
VANRGPSLADISVIHCRVAVPTVTKKENRVKRILSALAAVASVAALALGAAGTAHAAGPPPPFGLFISEVATGPELQDYIEIAPTGGPVTLPFDVEVQAIWFVGPPVKLATIPEDTTISPGQVYTIAHVFSGVPCANELFDVDLPARFPPPLNRLRVSLVQAENPSNIGDRGLIRATPSPFPPDPQSSFHRVSLTRFAPAPRTPCVPPVVVPDP